MFANDITFAHAARRVFALSLALLVLLCTDRLAPARAQQTFNSGSTGADGDFTPTNVQTITLSESGIYNYRNVVIPAGVTLTYLRNARNTPVVILATGNCTINGNILINGEPGTRTPGFALRNRGGRGGPAGFDGGGGGIQAELFRSGISGDGPGGGGGGKTSGVNAVGGAGGGGHLTAGGNGAGTDLTLTGSGGNRYGTRSLLPLIGGSGGGGGAATNTSEASGGGGGGGAILIACSGVLTMSSNTAIGAGGGNGGCGGDAGCSGGGAGGAIRLMATTINGTNTSNSSPVLNVTGGNGGNLGQNRPNGGDGGTGFVRIEAYNFNTFTPRIFPDASAARIETPGLVNLATTPTLRINSVAGVSVPPEPRGTLGNAPDIPFTTAPANPVAVELQAANIPLGTQVTVILTPESGASATVQSTPLAGTLAASTATASVTLPTGRSLLNATVTIDVNASTTRLAPEFIDGERVKQVRLAANWGGAAELIYITESGKQIKRKSE